MSGTTIDQDKIDLYYEKKKKEVSAWLINYTDELKKIEEDQRKRLLEYAKQINFHTANKFNSHIQQLPTVSKKEKQRLEKYLQEVDWLPEGVTVGFLDGQLVVKMLPNTQAEEMLREAFGPISEEEGDTNNGNRNHSDAKTKKGISE